MVLSFDDDETCLETRQVVFNHSPGALDLSAVYLDDNSTYMAEDTSFHGVDGEVRYRAASLYACFVFVRRKPGG